MPEEGAKILAGPKYFDCGRLQARISARQCLLNQGKAGGLKVFGAQHMVREVLCLDCPEGREMAAFPPGCVLEPRTRQAPSPQPSPQGEGDKCTCHPTMLYGHVECPVYKDYAGGAPGLFEGIGGKAVEDNALQIVIHNAFYRCKHLMARKSREYSPGEDRLENFKEAGALQGVAPEEALFGMLAKHLVSLAQMCKGVTRGTIYSQQAVWEEKLTDAHNYLFLLEALVKERDGWSYPEGKQ